MGIRFSSSISAAMLVGLALAGPHSELRAAAQTGSGAPAVKIVEPAAPLLPKQFGVWQQQPAEAGAFPESEDSKTRGVLYEDGLARASTSVYKRDGSGETLDIHAYQFGDATGAYSAFTLLRTDEFKTLAETKLGVMAAEKGDTVLLWVGTNVVSAEFHGGHRLPELSGLIAILPKVAGAKGLPPLLPTLLPSKGLEAESVKYALGSSGYEAMGGILPAETVGFDKSAEVVTAKYAGRGTLTLLLYPTPQIAGERGRQIEAEMNRQGTTAGTVKLRREGVLVLLTTGPWNAAEAQRLIEDTHMNLQLTYDKPMPLEFHAEVRKTASLLTSIAELSAALMLAAVVLGLFFGGGRALLRVLQGKSAATEPEFLRIDLRGGSGDGGRPKPLR